VQILITRPQPGAADTALALREHGHEPIIAPLSEIELLSDVDPKTGPWTAILLTSANGLWGIASFAWDKKWHSIPVFAVGDVSAKAARDMGFVEVASAGGNVNDLANLVAARLQPPARLLYLAGEERAGDLAGALRRKLPNLWRSTSPISIFAMVGTRLRSRPPAPAQPAKRLRCRCA
jgi:uroporphyrinogen-III synthase